MLTPLAIVWLVVHGGVITSVMILTAAAAASQSNLTCTCAQSAAERGTCPMHHKPSGVAHCRMQAAQTSPGTAVASMLGVAVPTPLLNLFPDDVARLFPLFDPPAPRSLTVQPTAPPPRA